MGWCTVKGCVSKKYVKPTVFMFPKDPGRRLKWIKFCKKPVGFILKRHHGICSEHFEPPYFESRPDIKKLKSNAVPTLNGPYQYLKGNW